MIKIIEIRKYLLILLKSIHPRVYFEQAPDNAVYPYIVYNLPNSFEEGIMEQFVLDIDAWDNSKDTTSLETLIDSVDQSLHRKVAVVNDTMAFIFYRENRLSLTDDDPRIRRRKYVYQIRTY
jgi:hypothetical protein